MPQQITRRESLKRGLAATSLVALASDWAMPALAQGETLVPFTDLPATINLTPSPERRTLDIRKIDGPLTPADQPLQRMFTLGDRLVRRRKALGFNGVCAVRAVFSA